jgi:AcrR family transcriptional regulator
MSGRSSADRASGPEATVRRAYNSPLRRQRAAETRTRIIAAGSALVHGFPTWDWRDLTFRAVATRAGVSERTVYRHFATEQDLHRAVMQRLEEEAGITYDGLRLEDLAGVTARVLGALPSFAVGATAEPEDPFPEEGRRRHDALLAAVAPLGDEWPPTERVMVAAILDILWAIPSYERLTTLWDLDAVDSIEAVTWVIGLVVEAAQAGRRPRSAPLGPARRPSRAHKS